VVEEDVDDDVDVEVEVDVVDDVEVVVVVDVVDDVDVVVLGGAVNTQPEPAVATPWLSVELAPAYQMLDGVATECWMFK
jgi:hypothetical protein